MFVSPAVQPVITNDQDNFEISVVQQSADGVDLENVEDVSMHLTDVHIRGIPTSSPFNTTDPRLQTGLVFAGRVQSGRNSAPEGLDNLGRVRIRFGPESKMPDITLNMRTLVEEEKTANPTSSFVIASTLGESETFSSPEDAVEFFITLLFSNASPLEVDWQMRLGGESSSGVITLPADGNAVLALGEQIILSTNVPSFTSLIGVAGVTTERIVNEIMSN
jgi:hypothetical protein